MAGYSILFFLRLRHSQGGWLRGAARNTPFGVILVKILLCCMYLARDFCSHGQDLDAGWLKDYCIRKIFGPREVGVVF